MKLVSVYFLSKTKVRESTPLKLLWSRKWTSSFYKKKKNEKRRNAMAVNALGAKESNIDLRLGSYVAFHMGQF